MASLDSKLNDYHSSSYQTSRFTDDFDDIEELEKGGCGTVFRARNKLDGQTYAVKRVAIPPRFVNHIFCIIINNAN